MYVIDPKREYKSLAEAGGEFIEFSTQANLK